MEVSQKLAFFEDILGKSKYYPSTQEALFFCPLCSHHKPKLSINLLTDNWQCFPCGKKGKKATYLLRQAGASVEDVKEYLSEFKTENIKIDDRALKFFKPSLPEGFVALSNCKRSIAGKKAFDYLTKKRKIEELDILRYKIGVATSGEFSGRIIFPSFNKKGKLNFFTSRASSGEYINIKHVPRGYKNTIILNEINIDWKEPVVIVEGFIDMLKSVTNTIPLFGSSMTEESLLFESIVENCSEVTLALDKDAQKKIDKMAKMLYSYNVKPYVLDLRGFNDLGEMTKKEFFEIYQSRHVWDPEGSFRNRLRML